MSLGNWKLKQQLDTIAHLFSSVQSLSLTQPFTTPWTSAHQASLSFTISQSLRKLMSIESVMPSNHRILCHLLLLLPSIFPIIRVFSNELTLCIRRTKHWSFSFTASPSSEYSGLISLRTDWLDLLAVQGTLKSLLQHHSSKASMLWLSAHLLGCPKFKTLTTPNAGEDDEQQEFSLIAGGSAKWNSPFGREFCSFLTYSPKITLPGVYPNELETYMDIKTCTQMFIAALFIIAKTWKQLQCPSVGEWINCGTSWQWNISQC